MTREVNMKAVIMIGGETMIKKKAKWFITIIREIMDSLKGCRKILSLIQEVQTIMNTRNCMIK